MTSLNPSDFLKSILGVGTKNSDSEHSLLSLNKSETHLIEDVQKLSEVERTISSSDSFSPQQRESLQIMLDDTLQEINVGKDGDSCREHAVHSSNVLLVHEDSEDRIDSQNVTHSFIASSDWGQSMPCGELITVHKNNKCIAYVLNGSTASGRNNSVVRIQSMGSGQVSLSCFHGLVLDLEFAWLDELLLAVIDQSASLFIFNIINATCDKFESKLLIRINIDSTQVIEYQRLAWIKFICLDQEDQSNDSIQLYLAQSHNNQVMVWNIKDVMQQKSVELVHFNDIKSHCFMVEIHPKPILDIKLSPDGTTLATTCMDGIVRFYEVNFEEKETKCVFQWSPHGIAPVNCISFLDNHLTTNLSAAKFWQFVVTCSSQLGEFKLSDCETWTCIQTFTFHPSPTASNDLYHITFKMVVHPESTCIALLDSIHKVVYFLKVKKPNKYTTYISSCYGVLFRQMCLSLAFEELLPKKCSEEANDISFYALQTKVLERVNLNTLATHENIISRHQPHSNDIFSNSSAFTQVTNSEPTMPPLISPFSFQESSCILPQSSFDAITSDKRVLIAANDDKLLNNANKTATNSHGYNDSRVNDTSFNINDNLLLLNEAQNLYPVNRLSLNLSNNSGLKSYNVEDINISSFKSHSNVKLPSYPQNASKIEGNLSNVQLLNGLNFDGDVLLSSTTKDLNKMDQLVHSVPANQMNINTDILSTLTKVLQQLESHGRIIEELTFKQKNDSSYSTDQLIKRIAYIENVIENNANKTADDLSTRLEVLIVQRDKNVAHQITDFITGLEDKLIKTMESELKLTTAKTLNSTVAPLVTKNLIELTSKLEQDFKHRITTSDALIKESIKDILKSKQLTDEIAKSIATNMEFILRDFLNNNFLPSFNNGCQNMVQQVQTAFSKGVNSFTQKLHENCDLTVNKLNASSKSKEAISLQLKSLVDFLENCYNRNTIDKELKELTFTVQKLFDQISLDTQTNLEKTIEKLTIMLSSNVQNILQLEMHSVLSNYEAKMSLDLNSTIQSRVSTPLPVTTQSNLVTDRNQLKMMIQSEHYNEAFKMALSLMDLEMVIYVCSLVDTRILLEKSIISLDQPVLYSLIQQLSADLLEKTNLKIRFLEQSLLAIDNKNESMLSHLNSIISQLCTHSKAAYHSPNLEAKTRHSLKNLINLAETVLAAQLLSA